MSADRVGALTAREIYVRTARVSWRHAGYLLLLGVVIFVPLGLVDALADRVQEFSAESHSEAFDLGAIALILAVIVQAATTLLGEVFYAGAVGLALRQGEGSPPPALREIAQRLSYGRLIAVDILFGLGTALGLVLLIVPGSSSSAGSRSRARSSRSRTVACERHSRAAGGSSGDRSGPLWSSWFRSWSPASSWPSGCSSFLTS